jgi:hypothetical protein
MVSESVKMPAVSPGLSGIRKGVSRIGSVVRGVPLSQPFGWIHGVISVAMAILFVGYAALFISSIDGYWFNPSWTTDDAYQQIFPFLEALHPGRFEGDIPYRMMKGYLTPLHYLLGMFLTRTSGSPIMAGHWMMLIQLVLSLGFLGAAVYRFAGTAPALFAMTWFLHTREVIQRLTCGLPRGWGAPIIAAFFFFAISEMHLAVLLTLAVGCILHPPTTMVVAMAYGMLLCLRSLSKESRSVYIPRLRGLILLSPAYIVVTYLSIKMPSDFGAMASLDVARSMPEFDSSGGRFPFVPLLGYFDEWLRFGFQAFYNKWDRPHGFIALLIPIGVLCVTAGLTLFGFVRKVKIVPLEVLLFGISAVMVHELSRIFAFYLYVPNRHLQIPMAFFFIVVFSAGIWKVVCYLCRNQGDGKYVKAFLGIVIVALVVAFGSGDGLQGKANFNTYKYQKGRFAEWIRENTPATVLVAGYPTLVDAVPLFGERRVFINTEMAHPFYRGYYEQIRDRITVSLKAHYAKDLDELYNIVAPLGISYFVFQRDHFYPEALKKASFFKPYDQLVYSLTRGDISSYAYRQLPKDVDLSVAPFMPFKDNVAAVVDIHRLGQYLGRE